jgi:ATP-dependent Lhr-like helicase
MEDSGWVRRGMFVAGLGAAQFAMPAAVDMLRSLRTDPETPEALFLAATDPANLYGSVLPWPRRDGDTASEPQDAGATATAEEASGITAQFSEDGAGKGTTRSLSRTSGAGVILTNGVLTAFLRRRSQEVQVFLPEAEPMRSRFARELAKKLAELAIRRQGRKTGLLIGTIHGEPARTHFLARFLEEAGFVDTAVGFQMRRIAPSLLNNADAAPVPSDGDSDADDDDGDAEASDIPETA